MAIKPGGHKLLHIETRNVQTPIGNEPRWIRNQVRPGPSYKDVKNCVSGISLHTICQEASYPGIHECWEDCEATPLIDGDKYARRCDFYQINSAKPGPLDRDEPRRAAKSVREMGLRYTTVTSVARDDLPGDAPWFYAETCRQVREPNPNTDVELLVDDFRDDESAAQQVFDAKPKVFAHNPETVSRIFKRIRPALRCERSLELIACTHEAGLVTKSDLTLGMGRSYDEIISAMEDLHGAGCDILTVTQYLRLTPLHHPIERWVKPEEFVKLSKATEEMGFADVISGPLVRSSYHAGRLYAHAPTHRDQELSTHLSALADDNNNNLALRGASTLLDRYGTSEGTPVTSAIPAS